VWCSVDGWKVFRNRNPEHPSGRCCVRGERGFSSLGGDPLQLQYSSKLQSTVRKVLYFSFLLWRMLIREEERHMLTYSTLSRRNSIFHSRVVLRTEDQHKPKPKVLGTPTADEAMPCTEGSYVARRGLHGPRHGSEACNTSLRTFVPFSKLRRVVT
jgi:hypothetical protein